MPKSLGLTDHDVWLRDWDATIGSVVDIVEIIKNWDPRTCNLADPAVSYIVFVAIVLVQIDIKLQSNQRRANQVENDAQNSSQLLTSFLHQLSNHWPLPKALLGKPYILLFLIINLTSCNWQANLLL
jgi:hypothetical protein